MEDSSIYFKDWPWVKVNAKDLRRLLCTLHFYDRIVNKKDDVKGLAFKKAYLSSGAEKTPQEWKDKIEEFIASDYLEVREKDCLEQMKTTTNKDDINYLQYLYDDWKSHLKERDNGNRSTEDIS